MAAANSFDVVSDFDRQELVNAVDQTMREIKGRYDLKDTNSTVELKEDKEIIINTKSDLSLDSIILALKTKASKRDLSLKIFDYQPVEKAGGDRVRQVIKLRKGIDQETAKKISKMIRDDFKKVQPQIQDDIVRVSSKSLDDLQAVIAHLKTLDLPLPLQCINFR